MITPKSKTADEIAAELDKEAKRLMALSATLKGKKARRGRKSSSNGKVK